MDILLMVHSILRWLIVLAGLLALVKFLVGWAQKSAYGKMERGLSAGFSGLMDLQVLLGVIYLFATGFGGEGFPAHHLIHAAIMLLAAAAAHVPAMFRKREADQLLVGLLAVLGALALVAVGVAVLPGGWSR
ncbi:MAG: hypothetical protein AB1846_04180 [Chloroflexota bacterium]